MKLLKTNGYQLSIYDIRLRKKRAKAKAEQLLLNLLVIGPPVSQQRLN